jgi:hypothetical protein
LTEQAIQRETEQDITVKKKRQEMKKGREKVNHQIFSTNIVINGNTTGITNRDDYKKIYS